ncbi:class I SAM-dependent methyltransferase [Aureimonas populi]|uniref:Class I SAM-dependent methyltransferase n=1 Tax=Aureimonas populi TaxID=1701758 RepID=A0ABW5CJ14_9HYPH|nr:class I SAM-dependent methyltransferase [Aureimonas populi]
MAPLPFGTNADIVDLRDFYATRLGQAVARSLGLALSPLWRPIPQERLVGLGYAPPILDRLMADAESTLAFMPAAQGAMRWPYAGAPATAMVEEDDLPLADASIDRVLMVHALEFSADPARMLAETWRVLAPGGRLVLVVPNRRGLWTRLDRTPFGSGRPWSRGQATRLLREAMFTTSGFSEALLFPPFRRASLLRLAGPMETAGRRFWPLFAGVIVIEATKLLYRGIPVEKRAQARIRLAKPALVPQGAALNREASNDEQDADSPAPFGPALRAVRRPMFQNPIVSSNASQERYIS